MYLYITKNVYIKILKYLENNLVNEINHIFPYGFSFTIQGIFLYFRLNFASSRVGIEQAVWNLEIL